MKNWLKITGDLILNIILVILAYYLLKYLLYPGIIATLFIAFYQRQFGNGIESISKYLRTVAVGIDQLGNIVVGPLFNLILIKKDGYKFGNPDETISGVLGKNQIKGTLTFVGTVLNWILNLAEKNHSINAIEEDENNK